MTSTSDLSKLTVPQLKALCKERGLTGYSKLAKAALLQKLAGVAVPKKAISTPRADETAEGNIAKTVQPSTASTRAPKAPLPTQVPELPQNRITTSARETSAKRPAHTRTPVPAKRSKTSHQAATNTNHEPSPSNFALQENLADASLFKVPELPVHSQRSFPRDASAVQETFPPVCQVPGLPVQPEWSFHGGASMLPETISSMLEVPELAVQPQASFQGGLSTLAKQPSGIKHPIVPRPTAGTTRFKPLVPATPKPVEPGPANKPAIRGSAPCVGTALDFSFPAMPVPVLSHISFPPRASERKWVSWWAIILSALSPADRKTCMLVSRTFRYAGRTASLRAHVFASSPSPHVVRQFTSLLRIYCRGILLAVDWTPSLSTIHET